MWSSLSEPRDLQYLQRGHPFGTNGSSTLQRAGGHLFRTSGVSTPQGACHSFLTQITTIHQTLYFHELRPAVYKELVWEKVGTVCLRREQNKQTQPNAFVVGIRHYQRSNSMLQKKMCTTKHLKSPWDISKKQIVA